MKTDKLILVFTYRWKQIINFARVWKCGCCCFSNNFLCWNISKWCFFIFLKLFLRSACQNNPKYTKKFNFYKKKIKIFWERSLHRVTIQKIYTHENKGTKVCLLILSHHIIPIIQCGAICWYSRIRGSWSLLNNELTLRTAHFDS